MSSSALLPNLDFNKLQVNRLKSYNTLTNEIIPETPKYLFSLVANATFDPKPNGGTLEIFDLNTKVITFTDRPFRQTNNNLTLLDFTNLFTITDPLENSFDVDPPNGVLIYDNQQRTYEITLNEIKSNSVVFNLNLKVFENETNISDIRIENSRINLFIDSSSSFAVNLQKLKKLKKLEKYLEDHTHFTTTNQLFN